jgi:hypothetical protein
MDNLTGWDPALKAMAASSLPLVPAMTEFILLFQVPGNMIVSFSYKFSAAVTSEPYAFSEL